MKDEPERRTINFQKLLEAAQEACPLTQEMIDDARRRRHDRRMQERWEKVPANRRCDRW